MDRKQVVALLETAERFLYDSAYDANGKDRVAPLCEAIRFAQRDVCLVEALEAAKSHMEYCGHEDAWKNQCPDAARLEEQIKAALNVDRVRTCR